MYDLCDLTKVVSNSGKGSLLNLSTFVQNWEAVLAGMKKVPEEEILENLFREQLRPYPQLSHDFALYDRSEPGKPERTYMFLMQSAKRWIQRQREDRNRKSIQSKLSSLDMVTVNALPSVDSDGKGNGRGRSKERGPRGSSPNQWKG